MLNKISIVKNKRKIIYKNISFDMNKLVLKSLKIKEIRKKRLNITFFKMFKDLNFLLKNVIKYFMWKINFVNFIYLNNNYKDL